VDFFDVLDQVVALLRTRERVSYRALKLQFHLDDDQLETLKGELIEAQELAVDKDDKMLVWKGAAAKAEAPTRDKEGKESTRAGSSQSPVANPEAAVSGSVERRHLTVLFCDLVGSTALSGQLDPEDLREVVRAYQATAAEVITRFDGHIAQYLGDGLLVYFGYPRAHEDDARRAVQAGLEIIEALKSLNARLESDKDVRLAVRLGIHTGLVVVGEIGSTSRHEQLALGETPNVAARLQGLAAPDTVVISGVTARLVQSIFDLEDLGSQQLKGVIEPLAAAHVLGLLETKSDDEDATPRDTPFLVGRNEEVGLLRRRWEQTKDGLGQVMLITGEAGIGKTALVDTLRADVRREGATRISFHCSPYHRNSVLYPVIEHMQHVFKVERDEPPAARLEKLERVLAEHRFPLMEGVPLFAALLSVPVPESRYPSLGLTPQQLKQETHDALMGWLVAESERKAVLAVWEDLQWADPSTLELLGLVIDQTPTLPMLTVLTFRPDFAPIWPTRSHMTPLTLNRLERLQVEALVSHLAGGKALPAQVLQQIVSKTDGVPLFVEELTKMVLESKMLRLTNGHYELTGPLQSLAIPVTLQDSLMARLDRLSEAREVVQLASVLGREFAYEILRLLTTSDDATLQARLSQLVGAELLYQRGRPPRARYFFKHALIQDAAYASVLKSARQRAHQQIGELFAEHFPEMAEAEPEVLAHHYTEAGLISKAIPYWQKAGQRAIQRSADIEAIGHLTKGLALLELLPDTLERVQQEIRLQILLGPVLVATKGNAAPEVEQVYTRARDLCGQLGETPDLFPVLFGLRSVYLVRGEVGIAHELSEQLLGLAERVQDSGLLLEARVALGNTSYISGNLALAQTQFEHALALYDPQHHRSHAFVYGLDPGVFSLFRAAQISWLRGYPAQALQKTHDALTLAREIPHSFSLAIAELAEALVHAFEREPHRTQQHAEATITLCAEHKFANFLAQATILRGWALAEQGLHDEGIAQIRNGLAACRATGAVLFRPMYLAFLIDSCFKAEQTEDGVHAVEEALAAGDKTGERFFEAELYRLKGTLTLQSNSPRQVGIHEPLTSDAEAEACFRKAVEIARQQSAKSFELRAMTSLSRLLRKHGKNDEARKMLGGIYDWFTEGFDTVDLKEAKALLEELS
jgi:class 3 adenylate cyclase/predicted ATPase